jgi:hypothetical protein
MKIAQNK